MRSGWIQSNQPIGGNDDLEYPFKIIHGKIGYLYPSLLGRSLIETLVPRASRSFCSRAQARAGGFVSAPVLSLGREQGACPYSALRPETQPRDGKAVLKGPGIEYPLI
jgi:hypothetical protein